MPIRVVVTRRGKQPLRLVYRTDTAANAALNQVWEAMDSGSNRVVHQSTGKPVQIDGSECLSACIAD